MPVILVKAVTADKAEMKDTYQCPVGVALPQAVGVTPFFLSTTCPVLPACAARLQLAKSLFAEPAGSKLFAHTPAPSCCLHAMLWLGGEGGGACPWPACEEGATCATCSLIVRTVWSRTVCSQRCWTIDDDRLPIDPPHPAHPPTQPPTDPPTHPPTAGVHHRGALPRGGVHRAAQVQEPLDPLDAARRVPVPGRGLGGGTVVGGPGARRGPAAPGGGCGCSRCTCTVVVVVVVVVRECVVGWVRVGVAWPLCGGGTLCAPPARLRTALLVCTVTVLYRFFSHPLSCSHTCPVGNGCFMLVSPSLM